MIEAENSIDLLIMMVGAVVVLAMLVKALFERLGERGFCQAYGEGRSCFQSMQRAVNIGWCRYLPEGKSCFMALDGKARKECEAGRIPKEHRHWLRLCHRNGRDRS